MHFSCPPYSSSNHTLFGEEHRNKAPQHEVIAILLLPPFIISNVLLGALALNIFSTCSPQSNLIYVQILINIFNHMDGAIYVPTLIAHVGALCTVSSMHHGRLMLLSFVRFNALYIIHLPGNYVNNGGLKHLRRWL
jgi:hypothetical protein